MKNINIDKLNEHLFETIEMLKNNKDPQADEHEKIDIETAKQIAELARVVVEGYKVKANVLSTIAKTERVYDIRKLSIENGLTESDE